MGSGNDNVQLGDGANTVILGDGNDYVSAGGGNNTVTVGNGNDNTQLGNGDNVVVEGNGNDYVSAGNGANLVVGGLGQHNIQLGNGSNILIDGSATVTSAVPGDSLRSILAAWQGGASGGEPPAEALRDLQHHALELPVGRHRPGLVLLHRPEDHVEQERDGRPELTPRSNYRIRRRPSFTFLPVGTRGSRAGLVLERLQAAKRSVRRQELLCPMLRNSRQRSDIIGALKWGFSSNDPQQGSTTAPMGAEALVG